MTFVVFEWLIPSVGFVLYDFSIALYAGSTSRWYLSTLFPFYVRFSLMTYSKTRYCSFLGIVLIQLMNVRVRSGNLSFFLSSSCRFDLGYFRCWFVSHVCSLGACFNCIILRASFFMNLWPILSLTYRYVYTNSFPRQS